MINYLATNKSFFALPLGSLQAELVGDQNWNMTWNKKVMLTMVQYQKILSPSPIIPPVPVLGIPMWVLDVHQI